MKKYIPYIICLLLLQIQVFAQRTLNTSYPVGTTSGAFNVTAGGDASYHVPIEVPPGTNGLVPAVSINYNSGSGNGIMGMGWSLSAGSAITRANADFYREGFSDGIDYDSYDRFALDGNRLVVISGTYGTTGSTYYTESESFVRVTAMETAGTGPQWFKVETKDGKTLEYGGTYDSRIKGSGSNVLVWQLSKVTDANGNYMTYSYYNNASTGEYRLTQIDYTGNTAAGLSPYNSVRFTYADRTDINTAYVYGTTFKNNKYLSKIETYNESVKVKEFQFIYEYDTYLHLKDIVEFGKDGQRYNSIFMGWGTPSPQLTTLTLNSVSNYYKKYHGDFNGDGKSDLLILKKNNTWEILLSSGTSMDLAYSGVIPEEYSDFVVGDYDGDGDDDVLCRKYESRTYDCNCRPCLEPTGGNQLKSNATIAKDEDEICCDECLWESYSYVPYSFNGSQFIAGNQLGIGPKFGKIEFGDFDGDGKQDYIVVDQNKNFLVLHLLSLTTNPNFNTPNDIKYLDFNGNGKTDIMVIKDSNCKIYEYNSVTRALETIYNGSFPTKKHYILSGDFNGDTNTDLLTYYDGQWKVSLSKGTGFAPAFAVPAYLSAPSGLSTYFVNDFNADGKCDIMEAYNTYGSTDGGPSEFTSANINIFYYNGTSFSTEYLNNITTPVTSDITDISDINGDGNTDIITLYGNQIKAFLPHIIEKRHLVSSISNGLNSTINISYKLLTDATVHTKLSGGTYPIIDYAARSYVVSDVYLDNGLGSQNQVNYFYTGAKFNSQLKGFLGFSSITKTDVAPGIKCRNYTELNPTFGFLALKTSETLTTDNKMLSITYFTNSTKNFSNKRFFAYVSQQSTTDYLHGNIALSATYDFDDYGNLTSSTTNSGGIVSSSTTNVYTTAGGWCLNRLANTSTTALRTGQNAYTTSASFKYYSTGQLKQKIDEPGTSSSVYTDYTYNAFGNIETAKTSPDGITGRTTTYKYDPKGRLLTKTTDDLGYYTENEYDYGLGKVSKTWDHKNLTTQFQYNGFGRLIKTIAPDLNESTITPAWVTGSIPANASYLVTTTSTGAPAAVVYYDKLGRSILSENTGLDGRKIFVETNYNSKGQVEYITLPYYDGESNASRKSFAYDEFGRLKTETAPGLDMGYVYNGLTTIITDKVKGLTYTRESDASGALINSTDAGGSISYIYNAQGQASQINTPTSTLTMGYDQFGRQTSMSDPNTGTYTYKYSIYGELTDQTDPKNRTTNMGYNAIGQPTYCNQGTFNTSYIYKANGLTESVSASNNISYTYGYGEYFRPAATTENIEGTTLSTGYEYNTDGTVYKVTYPGGFAVTYHYKNGYLEEIKRADTGANIWKVNAINARGQITQTTAGNGLVTVKAYNSNGYLTAINTGSGTIQNLEYHYNAKDLMDWRKDNRRSTLTESFGYDALNRLNTITLNGIAKSINYSANGNIQNKPDAGTYTYSATRPNAVEKVSGNIGTISTLQQDVTYTTFNKVNNITEGSNSATFTYGPDYARKKVVTNIGGTVTTRMYSGSYERETQGSITRELYYIVAGGEIVAIFEKKTGAADAMHYVHTDHLGSLNVITNQSGNIEQELSYDAWGNWRNPDTWLNITGTPANLITRRGFTGHEHIDEFGIINMNGRLYDPVLGRFFSPDPIIANAGSTQDYNRYSYCVNNPLMFTDPTGYTFAAWNMNDYPDGGGGGYTSLTPHLDAERQRSSGTMGYSYDWSTGEYIDRATREPSDYQTAQAWGLETASRNKNDIAERYIVYETATKNNKGEWVGNGNYGVIRAGIMEATIDPAQNKSDGGYLWYGKEGCGHALVYDPETKIAYEVSWPNRCDKDMGKAIKEGFPSIGHRYAPKEGALRNADFWGTCDDALRTEIDFAVVYVPDKAAAIAYYNSYVGKEWNWQPDNNCKSFVLNGFLVGGKSKGFYLANLAFPIPCQFTIPFTINVKNPFLK